MKEKTKEFFKKYLIGFVLGFVSVGIVAVYAETFFPSNDVTYDNKESGLESSDVQGAIDELYGVCTTKPAGEQIIEDAGLEKDPYECRYFFTGASPNNYITFNGENAGWRIISVECDGRIKIISDKSVDNQLWDNVGLNKWSNASLNTYLNSTYYNGLNSTAQSHIISSDFSIGGVAEDDNDLKNTISDENATKWKGNIALPTASEYIRTNSNKSECGTIYKVYNSLNCGDTSWMHNVSSWWTLTPDKNSSWYVFMVEDGFLFNENSDTYELLIKPTLYLSSDIKITGGNGSQSKPYTIE